jgi:hypothetical protein
MQQKWLENLRFLPEGTPNRSTYMSQLEVLARSNQLGDFLLLLPIDLLLFLSFFLANE